MRAKLYSIHKLIKEKDMSFDIEITIGRGHKNKVVLEKQEVSKKHLRIFFDDERACFFLEDFSSANGTYLDNIRVKGKEQLGYLHVISIAGRYDFIFQDLKLCKERHPNRAQPKRESKQQVSIQDRVSDMSKTIVEPKPFTSLPRFGKTKEKETQMPLPEKPGYETEEQTAREEVGLNIPGSLIGEAHAHRLDETLPKNDPPRPGYFLEIRIEETWRRFSLNEGENVIGRQAPAQVIIEKIEISRRHAVLTIKNEKVYLKDAGSQNKTYVDGKKIFERVEIQANVELRFGRVKARLVAGSIY